MGTFDESIVALIGLGLAAVLLTIAYLYWRYVWFFRDPDRQPPADEGIVSPADGTVVYVRQAAPDEDVVVIKQGLAARVSDIVREDVDAPKVVIGIFMSPLDVHYNRMPLTAVVQSITNHPGQGNVHMGPMHWRILLRREPRYTNSLHIVQNERTVTRVLAPYRGAQLSCYIVQIGAKTVNGIDAYFKPGQTVRRGEKFGMIRIGSQVDLVLPARPEFQVCVKPGDRVRAGESVLVR